ncbi:hypothetical protein DFH11DRAFT_1876437, partial [Phellopilus nigrolimitatus]
MEHGHGHDHCQCRWRLSNTFLPAVVVARRMRAQPLRRRSSPEAAQFKSHAGRLHAHALKDAWRGRHGQSQTGVSQCHRRE